MTYPGGKEGAGVFQRIIGQMSPHTTYVEGFLGGGAIMRMKRPAIASIGIDADRDVLLSAQSWAGTIPDLQLRHADAIRWLASHTLTHDTLVYLDPPYLMQTRAQQRRIYRCELTDADHARLLAVIVKLPCMVAISGYWSEMYAEALKDWRAISFKATTRGGTQATEWLWMNYPEPMELHDYRYLGEGFRERERIKRKKARWTRKLQAMPTLERHALMAAIDELRGSVITTPETAMQLGRHTPEMTMQPESATPDLPPSWHAAPPETPVLLELDAPDPTRVHDIAPPETVLLDQAAPTVTAIPDPNAKSDDGRRLRALELARPARQGQGQ